MSENLFAKTQSVLHAELFQREFANTENRYYVFMANHVPFVNDSVTPLPNNTVYNLQFETIDKMVCGKLITQSDIVPLALRNTWVANTSYQKYDDQLDSLEEKNFFVLSDEGGSYHVFKCLNNLDAESTSKPIFSETSEDDESYIKISDDYQWKFMYEISAGDLAKFSTDRYIPVYADALVANASVNGSIDVVALDFPGSQYNSYTTGFFEDLSIGGNNQIFALEASASANANFYNGSSLFIKSGTGAGQVVQISQYTVVGVQKRVILSEALSVTPDATSEYEISPYVTIIGNGSNASARALINTSSNSIYKIEVVTRGQDYSWANVTITGNTGVVNVSSNTAIQSNNALARAIISPRNGHGSNNFAELYASSLGISVTFANTESGKIPTTNDFRTIGIIKNPLLANVTLTIAAANNTLTAAMTVEQETTGASGLISFANSSIIRLTNAKGSFASGSRVASTANASISANVTAVAGLLSVFDASMTMTIELTNTGSLGTGFALDEQVTQGDSTADVLFANSTVVKLTNFKGPFANSNPTDNFITGETTGSVGRVLTITTPDIVKYSGEVLYIENMEPIQRANSQSETIKLVINF